MASPTTKALSSGARLIAAANASRANLFPKPAAALCLPTDSIAGCTAVIRDLIQQRQDELSAPWTGSIMFPVYPVHDKKDAPLENIFSKPPETHDICTFLGGGSTCGNNRLYFCPKTYPPPAEGATEDEIGEKIGAIDQALKNAASAAGSPLAVSRCGKKSLGFERNYQCDHSYFKHKPLTTKSDVPYRATSLISNDKSNRRKDGKSASKRTSVTDRAVTCPFNFRLKYDQYGFFITLLRQAGKSTHMGHPRYDPATAPEKSSCLTEEEKDTVKHVMDSCRSVAAGRNFVASKFNKYLSYARLAYLDSLGKDADVDEYDSLFTMLEKSEECRYNILWSYSKDDSDGTDISVVSSTKLGQADDEHVHVDLEDVPELAPVAVEAKEDRQGQGISENKTVFHAISWANEKVFRYFKLNPEAITCDVTSHTNRSGFHLLTFSTKTAIDKQVVFLRIWIPNQKRVSFRYVFQEALTKLIPEHIRDRVKFIMKDGDPQQGKEILYAIKTHFRNAIDGGCGYHIVNMGWIRHVKGCDCVPSKNLDLWKKITKGIRNWMYTWMRPGYCENEEEYKISKHLLVQFVSSRYVLGVTGGNRVLVEKIINFIRNHVFVYEDQYLHHLRRGVRNFEVSHSSAHEGTNFGLKSHAAAVQPTMTLDNAAAAMGIQDDMKGAACDHIVYRDFRNSNKTWSSLPTAPHLTSFGEGVLLEAHRRSNLYRARRIGPSTFQVVYVGPGHDPSFAGMYIEGLDLLESESIGDANTAAAVSAAGENASTTSEPVPTLVKGSQDDDSTTVGLNNGCGGDDGYDVDITDCAAPLFSRAHLVTLGPVSTCSCCRFERAGLPCTHIIASANEVCRAAGGTFQGFGHDSVAVRWWSAFMYYAYKKPTSDAERDLIQLYHAMTKYDAKGPAFHMSIPDSMKVHAAVPDRAAIDRLKNYKKSSVPPMDKFDGLFSSTHQPSSDQDDENELLSDEAVMSTLLALNSDETESVFENSISNVVGAHKPGVGIRQAMYPLWNEITAVHASLKSEEMDRELEELFKQHLAKMRGMLRERKSKRTKRRAGGIEGIVSEGYEGTAKRVYNTKTNMC